MPTNIPQPDAERETQSAAPLLLPHDLEMFQKLGIPHDLLEQARVQRVTDAEARNNCGIVFEAIRDCSGLWYPYFNPVTGRRTTGRLRRDCPELDAEGKPRNKYLAPYGDPRHLYILPPSVPLLADPTVPIVLIESEKAALAIWEWSKRVGVVVVPIAMGGCWGWKGRVGIEENERGEREEKRGPLPDLHYCDGHPVYVLLDSNCATNEKVQRARAALVRELQKKAHNCRVLVCDLPVIDGCNGPDDYLGSYGDSALKAVFDAARPASKVVEMPLSSKPEVPPPEPSVTPLTMEEAVTLTGTLLEACRGWILRFVVLGKAEAMVLAFWLLHSWAFDAAVTTPYIHVCSPEKESGKTTLLKVLKALARTPRFSSTISASALGRVVAKDKPSLFLDELDAQMKGDRERAQDIRGVLDGGFESTGTYTRCVGKNFEVVDFPTFSPKVLAGIGELWDTVQSRAIPIEMRRRLPSEAVESFRQRRVGKDAAPMTEALQNWMNGGIVAILEQIEVADVPGLGDRQMDIAEPLLQIAQLAGPEWNKKLVTALQTIFKVSNSSENATLLSDIRDIFAARKQSSHISSRELASALCEIEGRPWADWAHGRGLSPNNLARLLRKYRIYPATIWEGSTSFKGYRHSDFGDAWERYCPSPPISTVRPSEPAPPLDETHFSNRQAFSGPDGLKTAETRMDIEVLRPDGSKAGGTHEADAPPPVEWV
jgi:Protein of unknown function (DUF3631)/Domain of unknown function (DUF3854)